MTVLQLSGAFVIDKPAGITSHDVVDRIRRRLSGPKVGHLGTLDPAATGVLPVTVGKATRLAQFILTYPKEYTGEIRLGWATTTCDLEGEPVGEPAEVLVDGESVATAMGRLTGMIDQVPPAYSAKKISGVAAHRLARRGIAVDLAAVRIEVKRFDLVSFEVPIVRFHAVCSAGTYIRSLARDLGNELGVGAHLLSLRRIRSGPFVIEDALSVDDASAEDITPPEKLLGHLGRTEVDADVELQVQNGVAIEVGLDTSPICIFNKRGRLIAVARVERGWAHPKVVLI
jgi:tRNA pseudouridine55 synthase